MDKTVLRELPHYMKRDLLKELNSKGTMTPQEILDWTETLPIHILDGINNTSCTIKAGIVTVQPYYPEKENG